MNNPLPPHLLRAHIDFDQADATSDGTLRRASLRTLPFALLGSPTAFYEVQHCSGTTSVNPYLASSMVDAWRWGPCRARRRCCVRSVGACRPSAKRLRISANAGAAGILRRARQVCAKRPRSPAATLSAFHLVQFASQRHVGWSEIAPLFWRQWRGRAIGGE